MKEAVGSFSKLFSLSSSIKQETIKWFMDYIIYRIYKLYNINIIKVITNLSLTKLEQQTYPIKPFLFLSDQEQIEFIVSSSIHIYIQTISKKLTKSIKTKKQEKIIKKWLSHKYSSNTSSLSRLCKSHRHRFSVNARSRLPM